MKYLIAVHSWHHNNTKKIADAMAKVLDASVKAPSEISDADFNNYRLIGLGAGIDSGHHYNELLKFAEKLPHVNGNSCFIFSTSGVQGKAKVYKDHMQLRNILMSKGYSITGEFSCLGFNTNSFLKHIGGLNKGRPNEKDLTNAERFALSLHY